MEVEQTLTTERAELFFGRRCGIPVVLKVTAPDGDEARQGEVLAAFQGRGAVWVHAHEPGAVLMERALPGSALTDVVVDGRDDEATAILARTLGSMDPGAAPAWVRTAEGLAADLTGGVARTGRIPQDLLSSAQASHASLCASRRQVRLLHGDLHHDNLLFDRRRGWLAVDPKGILGEPEFEAGALFRNPWQRPDLFRDPARIRARLACLGRALPLDLARVRSWGFVQAVLAAIWGIEDGIPEAEIEGCFVLARMLQETA